MNNPVLSTPQNQPGEFGRLYGVAGCSGRGIDLDSTGMHHELL
jgi:hypothetical protein